MRKVKLLEVPSEIAAGTRGASLGIGALKTASLDNNDPYFGRYESVTVVDENTSLFQHNTITYARRIEALTKVLERVCESTATMLQEGHFPVILAGDHGSAAGTISGIKKAHPGKRLGAIWIDAHADMNTPYTTPSGNMHGMPLAIAAQIDNLESKERDLDPETLDRWEKIKQVGGPEPKINPKDVVFIGVRDMETPEYNLLAKYGIKNFSVDELRRKGASAVVHETMELLEDCDIVYISFDVDSMDPRFSEGTGTPVPNGITPKEAKALNVKLASQSKVVAWEMVEINPTLGYKNDMAELAFDILQSTTQSIEMF